MTTRTATATAPASVGNVGVGFDILGFSVEGPFDRVTVHRVETPGVRLTRIGGVVTALPPAAEDNTAGVALLSLSRALHLPFGFEVELEKGIPLGSGLGGSAASAVGAVVAANALLDTPLPREALYQHAVEGEARASGGRHGDNVGPCLLGGLVLATHDSVRRLPSPPGLWAAIVHPHFVLETKRARESLSQPFALKDFVTQSENLAQVLLACFTGEVDLLKGHLADVLVEPRRASLIPGFADVKKAALEAGALGATISGAGPSVFGWYTSREAAAAAGAAMQAAFLKHQLGADVVISPVEGPRAEVVA